MFNFFKKPLRSKSEMWEEFSRDTQQKAGSRGFILFLTLLVVFFGWLVIEKMFK